MAGQSARCIPCWTGENVSNQLPSLPQGLPDALAFDLLYRS